MNEIQYEYTCKRCGGRVSANTKQCPHCGVILMGIEYTSQKTHVSPLEAWVPLIFGLLLLSIGLFIGIRLFMNPDSLSLINIILTGILVPGGSALAIFSIDIFSELSSKKTRSKPVKPRKLITCPKCGEEWNRISCEICGKKNWLVIAVYILLGLISIIIFIGIVNSLFGNNPPDPETLKGFWLMLGVFFTPILGGGILLYGINKALAKPRIMQSHEKFVSTTHPEATTYRTCLKCQHSNPRNATSCEECGAKF
jgi:hypothetical protein